MNENITYKKTNIPWMEEIPKHWEVRRLKSLYNFGKGQGLSKLDISNNGSNKCLLYGELFTRLKGYNLIDNNFQTTNVEKGIKSQGNEMLIPGSTTTTSIDLCNCKTLNHSSILLGGDIIILKPFSKDILNEYFSYFISSICKSEFVKYGRGVTIHHIYANQIGNMRVCLPPLSEQIAIANYLDSQSKKIKHFIKKKQTFIVLLKEQRQAVISAMVSGQLLVVNGKTEKPTKTKYSGIDWLGDIPEHWGVRRLRTLGIISTSSVDKTIKDGEKIVSLVNYTDVYGNNNREILNKTSSMRVSANKTQLTASNLIKGDVLFTPSSETIEDIGKSAVVMEDLDNTLYSYHLLRLRFYRNEIFNTYKKYMFNNPFVQNYFSMLSKGSTRKILNLEKFKNLLVPIPPKEEQTQIVSHIQTETAKIDQAIAKAQKEIELIKEYKEAMIAEAVLGKLIVNA